LQDGSWPLLIVILFGIGRFFKFRGLSELDTGPVSPFYKTIVHELIFEFLQVFTPHVSLYDLFELFFLMLRIFP
jgi:hypothetical protein